MSDDLLDWFLLTPEQRADKEIRADLEWTNRNLAAQSRSHRLESDRLRAQLNERTASIEQRLDRLSTSFAAYVELGEVREKLASLHGDSVEQRRQAIAALTRLAKGDRAERLQSDNSYWLPDAVNAVIAIVEGAPDPDAEGRARALEPRADEFFVLAAAALDKPELVADRLPDVMINDGALSPSQYLLWRSSLAGDFGPVVASLERVVTPALKDGGWGAWVSEEAHRSALSPIAWLERLTRQIARPDEAIPAPAQEFIQREAATRPATTTRGERGGRSDSQKALTAAMLAMVQEGEPAERELTLRERTLMAVLADPSTKPVDEGAAVVTDLTAEVRLAMVDESLDPAVRRPLIRWAVPMLKRVVDQVTTDEAPLVRVQADIAGRAVEVTSSGYDEARVASLLASRDEAVGESRSALLRWSMLTGTLLAGGLVALLLGHQAAGLVLLLVAAGCLVPTVRTLWTMREERNGAALARSKAMQQLAVARDRVSVQEAERAEERGRRLAVEELLRLRLTQ